jgi:hypothetical protein
MPQPYRCLSAKVKDVWKINSFAPTLTVLPKSLYVHCITNTSVALSLMAKGREPASNDKEIDGYEGGVGVGEVWGGAWSSGQRGALASRRSQERNILQFPIQGRVLHSPPFKVTI